MEKVEHLPPHWIDDVINDAAERGDADAVAYALMNSDRIMAAIRAGIEAGRNVPEKVRTSGKAQKIRVAIVETVVKAEA